MIALLTVAFAVTLDEAWESTLQHSQEARLAAEIEKQGRIAQTQAWTSLGPRLSVGGNWTYNERETTLDFASNFPPEMLDMVESFTGEPLDLGDPVVINKQQYFDANITIIQPIINLRAFPGLAAAKAMAASGDANAQVVLGQLRLGVVRAYTGVWLARQAESVAERGLAVAADHLAAVKTMVSVGSLAPLAELQADVARRRAERDLAAAALRRREVEASFAALTDLDATAAVELPAAPSIGFGGVDDALTAAQSRRPEWVYAEQSAKAAKETASASMLTWAPTLDARFTQAWTENEGFGGEPSTWMFVASASWPLWDAGYRLADNARTASAARQAAASFEKTKEDTAVAVHSAWDWRAHSVLAVAAARAEVQAANEALRLAETGLSLGGATLLDVEDARLAAAGAALALAQAQVSEVVAGYTLMSLTGG